MTLEYRACFEAKELAVNFQDFLKSKLVSSRIETKAHDYNDSSYRGTYHAFEKLIEEASDSISLYDDDDEKREAVLISIDRLRIVLKRRREAFSDLYARYPVGVAFSLGDLDKKRDEYKDADAVEQDEILKCFAFAFLLKTLDENGAAEFNEETNMWTILEKKEPDEVVDEFSFEGMYFGDPEVLKSCGISVIIDYCGENTYTVVTSPHIILANLNDIKEYLENTGVFSTEELEEGFDFLYKRKVMVMYIIGAITGGCSTADELSDVLYSFESVVDESGCESFSRINVSAEFLDGVLADMKLLGMITIKNGRLGIDKKFSAFMSKM